MAKSLAASEENTDVHNNVPNCEPQTKRPHYSQRHWACLRSDVSNIRTWNKIRETPNSQLLGTGSLFRKLFIIITLEKKGSYPASDLPWNVKFFQLATVFYEGILLHSSLMFIQYTCKEEKRFSSIIHYLRKLFTGMKWRSLTRWLVATRRAAPLGTASSPHRSPATVSRLGAFFSAHSAWVRPLNKATL